VKNLHGISKNLDDNRRQWSEYFTWNLWKKLWTTTEDNGAKTLHGISKNLDDNRRHWSENFTWNLWKKLWTTTEVVEKLISCNFILDIEIEYIEGNKGN
jgi:predicted KAP-like P-loop ATPase